VKNNRKKRELYLLSNTITKNALNKEINMSFKTKEDIIRTYSQYNQKFNIYLKDNNIKYYY
jgi:uncharacterized protein YijF (DUF1287 family)